MRIAVIGDIHANLPALLAVLADVELIGCDAVYCVGDVVGRGPHPNQVVEELARRDVPAVQGNWDEAVGMEREHSGATWSSRDAEAAGQASLAWTITTMSEENRGWLRTLPPTLRVNLAGRTGLFFHGSPLRQSEYLWAERPSRTFARIASDEGDDLFCFGHTHEAFHRVVGPSHFVAAGSVGCGTGGDPRAKYAIVYIGQPEVAVGFRSVEFDMAAVLCDMVDANLPIELLRVPPRPHLPAGHVAAHPFAPGDAPRAPGAL
jgi:predicted phosphodiesterase